MKKIMCLALAAAFVGPFAMADVSIYGQIRYGLEYDHTNYDFNGSNSKLRLWDQGSRLASRVPTNWIAATL